MNRATTDQNRPPASRPSGPETDHQREPQPRPKRLRGVGRVLAAGLSLLLVAAGANGESIRLDADRAAQRIVAVSHLSAAAAARSAASRSALAAADAAALPTIAATASLAERSSVPEFSAPLNGPLAPTVVIYPDIRTTYAAGLRAEQPIYTGGAIASSRSAARSELVASEAGQALTAADLRLAARQAYWESVRAQAALLAARANRARAQRLLQDTRSLLTAGMAVRADVLASEARSASAEVAVIRSATAADEALSRLRSLLHLPATDAIELADTITEALPAAREDLGELAARADATRPEIAALDAQIRAAEAREALALSPTRPALALAAAWDLARPNQRYFPQTDQWKSTWAIGVSAAWTLFDGGKARAETAVARAGREALTAQRAEMSRRIALEVETAWRDLTSALAAVGAADSAQASASERERAAKERHEAGLAAMSEILDAEAGLADAEQQQIDTRASAWLASARLARALGQ